MHSREELLELVKETFFWEVKPDGFVLELLDGPLRAITLEEVALVDERLPIILREHAATSSAADNRYGVLGSSVDTMLEYWENPYRSVLSLSDGTLINFKHIVSITPQYNGEVLEIYGQQYETKVLNADLKGASRLIEFAHDNYSVTIPVERALMDKHYPNWEDRWNMAVALDILTKERPVFLLTNAVDLTNCAALLPPDLSNDR